MTKIIKLSGIRGKGKECLVDDGDYEYLNQFSWYVSKKGYPSRTDYSQGYPWKTIRMHRFLMNTPEGMETDHINGNTLDNQRSNLRVCLNYQNQANRGARKDNILGLRGVHSQGDKYQAQISKDYVFYYLGTFDTKEDAARAYNEKAKELFGNYAKLNDLGVTA